MLPCIVACFVQPLSVFSLHSWAQRTSHTSLTMLRPLSACLAAVPSTGRPSTSQARLLSQKQCPHTYLPSQPATLDVQV